MKQPQPFGRNWILLSLANVIKSTDRYDDDEDNAKR
jgi:hypothetical protein